MPDTKELLERAARVAPRTSYDVSNVRERGAATTRKARRRAAGVSIVIILGLVLGSVAVLRSRPAPSEVGSGSPRLPAAWEPVPALAEGDFSFTRTVEQGIASGEQRTDGSMRFEWERRSCDAWWAPDGSGRLRCDVDGRVSDERFATGGWPTDLNTAEIPMTPAEIAAFVNGAGSTFASPVADVTPTPGAKVDDTRLWRFVDSLVADPNAPPRLRVALIEVLADLSFARVDLDVADPVGRPAYRIRVVDTTEGESPVAMDYYVDPATHLLLATANVDTAVDRFWNLTIVESDGVSTSTDNEPGTSAIPSPVHPMPSLDSPGGSVVERCSQGSSDLELTLSSGGYDHDCFVVEAGAPFSITFVIETPEIEGGLRIVDPETDEIVLDGERITGPDEIRYDVGSLGHRTGEANTYAVLDGEVFVGTLYAR